MQLTLGSGSTGHHVRIAGVALLGAGLIAANPVAPTLAHPVERSVQLNNAWETLAADTQDSLKALTEDLGVSALFKQEADNLSDYGKLITGMDDVVIGFHDDGSAKTTTSGVEGFSQGLEQAFVTGFDKTDVDGNDIHVPGLTTLVQEIFTDLQNGDPSSAFNDLNLWSLYGLEVLGKPLMPVLTIPERMLENFTSVMGGMFGPEHLWDFVKGLSKTSLSPMIAVGYEFSAIMGADDGDGSTSLTDAPAELLNAFLNGVTTVGDNETEFTGLLNGGSLLDDVLNVWPSQVAELLTAGTADLPDAASGGVEALSGGVDIADGIGDIAGAL